MIPETINQVKELLAPIALKIGQTAEWGWGVVLKQQYVVAVLGIAQVIMGLILAYIVYVVTKLMWQLQSKDEDSAWGILGVFLPLLGIIFVSVLIVGGGYDAITHFINPDYYAIDFFIHLAK